ncbi:MAG: isopenicillin N synthase family dioxygenase [Acidimicrobiales bacterium]
MFTQIPEVDLRRKTDELVEEVRAICHEVGFFLLVGHGIEASFIERHVRLQRQLFELPAEVKATIDKGRSSNFRGWEGVGAELTGGLPDLREQLDLATENPTRGERAEPPYLRLDGPNQWPSETVLPGFRAHMNDYFDRMSSLADRLLDILSLGLGLGVDHLRDRFGDRPLSLVKLIDYPPTPEGGAGVNPHHDAGFLTLLLQHDVGGLQVQNPAGDWIDVPPRQDALVVNLGEMLQEMTGNYFVATTHRVVTGSARQSSAWFHGPDLRTELTPLDLSPTYRAAVAASERHANAGFMAKVDELTDGVDGIGSDRGAGVYGQQLWNYYCRSYPANVAKHHPDHVPNLG